jgi:peptidyl-prolyl cis-trans isomerase SurA
MLMSRKGLSTQAIITLVTYFGVIAGAVVCYAELVDRVVAIVNEDAITLSELNEAVQPYAKQIRANPYNPEEELRILLRIRQDVLNRMIDEKLTYQESKKLEISVDESDLDRHIERIRSEQILSEDEFEKVLAAEGYTLQQYRKRIKEQLLRVRLITMEVKSKIAITEEEIRDYYEKHKEAYQGIKKYHLRTILVRVPSSATTDESAEARRTIEAIEERLKAGDAFDELAKQYSDHITAKDGGNLGAFLLGELSAQFQETVPGMKEGQFSPVLQTPQGYQVLMLQEIKHTPGKTLKEARIEIQERLYQEVVNQKIKDWLMALRERSYIRIIQ